jgi:uncharacterized protein (TIGR00730 family)
MPALTVYGSSSPRTPAAFLAAAAEVGRLAAQRGWTVINGAGSQGCMGACTDACLAAGGTVRGVILRKFADDGLAHPSLADLAVAEDMRTRKRLLAESADAFLGLPGGPGTWEEVWEIAVQRQIGALRAPLVLVDIDGCWQPVRAQLERAARDGLLYGPPDDLLAIEATPEAAIARIALALANA